MKKTKNIKLVLITSLIGSAGAMINNSVHAASLNLIGNNISYSIKDAVAHSGKDTVTHSGATVVPRGGFGASGHHSHAAS